MRKATATATTDPDSKVSGGEGTAAVTFGDPSNVIDECVNVSDDKYGELGTFCANGSASQTYTYSLNVGPYTTCGDDTYTNTASFVTNDTGATDSDSWTVNVNIPCQNGCTLTQGYWKTHSLRGPAPYDDAWLLLSPLGADTPFFTTGRTWYQVFWTAPAGNAAYNLAHQYTAAKLNILSGASAPSAVTTAITQAESLFSSNGLTAPTGSARSAYLSLASTLDRYNNGVIGPGHCSE